MPIFCHKAAFQRPTPTSVPIHLDPCGIKHNGQQSLFGIWYEDLHAHVVGVHAIQWQEISTRCQTQMTNDKPTFRVMTNPPSAWWQTYLLRDDKPTFRVMTHPPSAWWQTHLLRALSAWPSSGFSVQNSQSLFLCCQYLLGNMSDHTTCDWLYRAWL